ncbi:GTP-binding protein [Xanthobacter dioxanivorans]|uniref:GTP-binding protein n=1 Tax=Xanthobacter dioxanivorans TaxID=2528964 RepID=A0A974PQ86_9HYPH|nr:GTP-binding protein [Xanthobacter dioxanivorans]QRG07769.1 GTP-binding protein [Xanthobacter dioxanivorans]
MSDIPVVLLTGFLGSGKTTLLNDLLRRPAFRDTAVVINEAGDAGIDHALIETGSDEVLLLEGGCICCRLKGSLNTTLNGLLRRRALDGFAFRRVVVETSGLADPAPILHALIADPLFNRHFSIAGVTTVVDAANFPSTLAHHAEGVTQVALADRILVTKTDLVSPAQLSAVESEVAALNPLAERHLLSHAGHNGGLIWLDPRQEPRPMRRRFAATAVSHAVATASLAFPGRLTREAVDDWLDRIGDLFGGTLLRLKGILQLEELAEPVVLHGVQGLVYSPGTLSAASGGVTENRMVLIGRGMEEQDLQDALTLLAAMARLAA